MHRGPLLRTRPSAPQTLLHPLYNTQHMPLPNSMPARYVCRYLLLLVGHEAAVEVAQPVLCSLLQLDVLAVVPGGVGQQLTVLLALDWGGQCSTSDLDVSVRGRRAVMAGTAGHMGWSDWV